jgi:DNA polymerase-3 subunit gamma/tau
MPEQDEDDGPPSWVTEFSDDTAVAQDTHQVQNVQQAQSLQQAQNLQQAVVEARPATRAPAMAAPPYVITPVPEIDWDGNWPGLAATLPLRGVAQQLAFQTQLVSCTVNERVTTFRLCVPIDTLRASGNTDKLCAALQERFAGTTVHVEIDIGPVWYTASAEARAYREECQRLAEQVVASDPFVQELQREFGAFVVPGSIHPPASVQPQAQGQAQTH